MLPSFQTFRSRQLFLNHLQTLPPTAKLLAVVAQLRNPEGGCPWDLKQTHQTLRPYVLEEAYEVVEAIDANLSGSSDHLKEELGDLMLQIVLHSQLAQESGAFTFEDVCQGIADKLIRRHPHVFSEAGTLDSPEAVSEQWQQIKQQEKQASPEAASENNGGAVKNSVLSNVPLAQPALSRALQTSQKAVAVGFEWPSLDSLWACVLSEFDELKAEIETAPNGIKWTESPSNPGMTEILPETTARIEEEMGDIFFATVNLSRHLKVNPEVALTKATQKFVRRFQWMEAHATSALETLTFEEWDVLWNQAKAALAQH